MSEEFRNIRREEGEVDRLFALHVIHRGALQVAASALIGQNTQQRAGESEVHRGLTMWEKWREEQGRRRREEASTSRTSSGRINRKRKVKLETPPAEQRPLIKPMFPVSVAEQQSRSARKLDAAFSTADLKELRKAIKAKDEKLIAELTSKIGRPSQID